MNYRVVVKGARPLDLARKIAEAHAEALKPKHYSHTRYGPGVTTSRSVPRKNKTTGT